MPLIVLGNARDNRVMHALGTRHLLQSNRSFPGGDRYLIEGLTEQEILAIDRGVSASSLVEKAITEFLARSDDARPKD